MQCMSVPSNSQPGTATTSNTQVVGTVGSAQHEEPLRQIVYSTVHTENTATIGPTTLQGVGTVDGVASVAKVLLQMIQSSVCAKRHAAPVSMAMPGPGQPMPITGMPPGM